LRDDPAFRFEQLMDLCGIDYSEFTGYQGKRLPRSASCCR
jgi:NADH:ubiquinone oxidoreductase subunit C